MLFLASTTNTLLSQNPDSLAPVLVQLDYPLTQVTQEKLRAHSVELLHHYGDGAYLISRLAPGIQRINPADLVQHEATVLQTFGDGPLPLGDTRLDVDLVLAFETAPDFLSEVLAEATFNATVAQIENGRTLNGNVAISELEVLLAHPYILDATPSLTEVEPYNFEARIVQSVTPLNSGIAGAPGLNGRGIVIGVGDGGALAGHPDMGERVLHSTSNYNAGWGNHPDMVSGIIAGAGNVYGANRGVAPEAELIVETNSAITYYAPTFLQDYGMTITNNSYGPSFHCNTANQYFGNSASTDQQLFDNPTLLHIYAVGNSGRSSCADVPVGYSTIPGGPQNAKNTLSVGNVSFNRQRYETSSAGPTKDGRLKPEISAVGTSITTTIRDGGYGTGTGTSFAAPNVASTIALLSEAYQRNSPGTTPTGALLKAIACNTADDAGRPGPDFEYGFGILNAYNALQVIDNNQFELGTITKEAEVKKTINLEVAATELKVMLYWSDVAGSTSNQSSVLENDLELVLISETGETTYPLILDPSDPLKEAVQGEDHLNNIEQITLKNPAIGEYEIIVRATNLDYGEGTYVLTWFSPEPEVVLTCPYGGESIVPGQSTYIAWTATSGDQGKWRVEYSENGQTWTIAADDIPGADRSISWGAPPNMTHADFRITNTETNITDVTNATVSIVTPPLNLTSTEVCETTLQLSWSPTAGAESYSVYQFDGEQMQHVGTTTDTLWPFDNLGIDEALLLSVAATTTSNYTSNRAYGYEVVHSGQEPACQFPSIVEWGALSTEELGAAVRVHWDVNREQRIERFELERGVLEQDNVEWTYVDAIDAKGTSAMTLGYSIDDPGAAAEGTTHYRIRMVDQDGLSLYSDEFTHTRSTTSATQNAIGTAEGFTLLQNPVGQTMQINSNESTMQTVHLYDAIGRKRASFDLQSGPNVIAWPLDLGTGLYILRGTDQAISQTVKLIHQ